MRNRIRRHLSYANVASSIAVFVAVSTGGAYAATTLAKNSVRTGHIKNGQVTLADLHPQVKKRLGTASGGSGAGTTPTTGKPGAWADSKLTVVGAWSQCTASCGEGTMGSYHAGPHVGPVDVKPLLGAAKTVNYRWVGSITNTGTELAYLTVFGYRGSKPSTLHSSRGASLSCTTPYAGIQPGQALTVEQLGCHNNPDALKGIPADQTRYMRTRVDLLADDYIGDPPRPGQNGNGFPEGIVGDLRLEIQPVT